MDNKLTNAQFDIIMYEFEQLKIDIGAIQNQLSKRTLVNRVIQIKDTHDEILNIWYIDYSPEGLIIRVK